ncbi:MAG: plastocyanin/azurin family copper-binding protein [Solirubrobacterales bacterium]
MRRVVAALIAALALGLLGAVGASGASAAECTWQRNSKRVVKQVRRHGRLRKVVRHKRWWSCDPVAATAPAPAPDPLPAPTLPPSEPLAPAPEPEPEANRLAVKSVEYYFVLSRATVKAGALTVELNNQGEDPHNLNLQREDDAGEPLQIEETDSLQRNVATFVLPPGTYRLWCSLPEHEERGMHTTLVVE